MKEAMFYEKLEDKAVHCMLCPHDCRISDGKYGVCRVRKNNRGILTSENYGIISSIAMDPVEKKPLYHFYPGKRILSAGSFGCNMRCAFCQNWEISQQRLEGGFLYPAELVNIAKRQGNNIGIAFTYNEPSIWYEYVYDCLMAAKENSLKTVLVTNGYINMRPLKYFLPYVDAMNIDVKAYKESYYEKVCYGSLKPVLKTVEEASKHCHVEVTTLLVTGLNDDVEDIENLTKWLSQVDKNIPIHFTRYFPNYKMNNPATPMEKLQIACDIGKKYLNFVYAGNVAGFSNNTFCPNCGNLLVKREMQIKTVGLDGSRCTKCGNTIKIVN